MLSTDDMRFCADVDPDYKYLPIFNYETISRDIKDLLLEFLSLEDTNNIMYENAHTKIVDKLLNQKSKCKVGK